MHILLVLKKHVVIKKGHANYAKIFKRVLEHSSILPYFEKSLLCQRLHLLFLTPVLLFETAIQVQKAWINPEIMHLGL